MKCNKCRKLFKRVFQLKNYTETEIVCIIFKDKKLNPINPVIECNKFKPKKPDELNGEV